MRLFGLRKLKRRHPILRQLIFINNVDHANLNIPARRKPPGHFEISSRGYSTTLVQPRFDLVRTRGIYL